MYKKFRCPFPVDPQGDIWIVDRNFYPILVMLKKHIPEYLQDWVNTIMKEIWITYRMQHKNQLEKEENRF